ncbi:coiled-coil domain-containing protein 113 isoform X1 [Octopus bimaculoides]|uniref:DUF4201 domain-containing protein n=1 Tax=Octopus bimaculoides TaxID=37653 RepID=A0A0L8HY46_OCTBM|nr:coiled-coil domain-containing protein 113 isoform X1 [Octopus bimaculoides]|eukprot:XP_014768696.1 PREDICTED: coiled-coil domain-containing protein 113-like [Octopus bimaculoides]
MKKLPSNIRTIFPALASNLNDIDSGEAGHEDLQSLKSRRKRMWLIGALSFMAMEDLSEKVKETEKRNRFLSTETSMFEKYLEDKLHASGSGVSNESSSVFGSQTVAKSQPPSPAPFAPGIIGVARKVSNLTTEQKLLVARYYIMALKEELKLSKKTSQHFIALNLALLENYNETLAEIPLERRELEMEFGILVKENGKIPFLRKWQKYVATKDTKRESLICLIKLRNISLVNKIKKQIMIKKYRDEVDPIEFYSKWTEKKTLIEEIHSLNKQKSRLRRALVPIERYTYEKKQELENDVKQGEEFRQRILRENHSLVYLLNKQQNDEVGEKYEKVKNERLKALYENYRVPSILEYIILVKDNKEWRELIEKWKQKAQCQQF